MIDQDTTASEQTTETTSSETASPGTASTDTSTTATETQPSDEGTLLTPKTGEGEAETTETQTEQTPEEKAAAEAQAALYGAPEGEYTLPELPEGQTVDAEALAVITPVAKELNLSDAGFAKVIDVYAKDILPKVQQQMVDGLQKDIVAEHAKWANESMEMLRTDDEFKGMKLADVQATAAKALDRFGGTEIREFLQTTGLGNHPAFLKAFHRIGSAISEDTSFERGGQAPAKKTSTEKFYGPQS